MVLGQNKLKAKTSLLGYYHTWITSLNLPYLFFFLGECNLPYLIALGFPILKYIAIAKSLVIQLTHLSISNREIHIYLD